MAGKTSSVASEWLHVCVLYEDPMTFERARDFCEALAEEMHEMPLEPSFHLLDSSPLATGNRLRLQALMGEIDMIVIAIHPGAALPAPLQMLAATMWYPRKKSPLGLVGLVGSAESDHEHFVPQHRRLLAIAREWGIKYLPEGVSDSNLNLDEAPVHEGNGKSAVHPKSGALESLPSTAPRIRDWGINE